MKENYRTESEETRAYGPPSQPPQPHSLGGPHLVAARGLAQMLGVDAPLASITIVGDFMLHGADVITAGLLVPFSIVAGIGLAVVATRVQMKFYGDDLETAALKGFLIGLLTAIPSPLPYFLFVPAGIVGYFHNRGK